METQEMEESYQLCIFKTVKSFEELCNKPFDDETDFVILENKLSNIFEIVEKIKIGRKYDSIAVGPYVTEKDKNLYSPLLKDGRKFINYEEFTKQDIIEIFK